MSDEAKLPVGRPSKYNPEYCDKVIAYGKDGDTLVHLARELGVAKSTLYEWAGEHKEFSDALAICKSNSEAYWLDLAKNRGAGLGTGSDTIIKYMLAAAHGLREGTDNTVQAEITGTSKVEIHFSELVP